MSGDILGLPQSGLDNLKTSEHGEFWRHQPFASSQTPPELLFNETDPHHTRNNEVAVSKKVTFGDLVKNPEMDEPDNRGHLNDAEPSVNWNSKASATTPLDDPDSYSPFLPPVLEEPPSTFSEAADDDPLPAIEGLQISGEAIPGQQLQACGYSTNGTASCNFEWVRHSEDGSFNYVEGAKQPNYLVTADDVDTYLAIEVQPLDDRKRKGELVKVFANEHRKITCDTVMLKCIEKTLYTGHVSYKLSLSGVSNLFLPQDYRPKNSLFPITLDVSQLKSRGDEDRGGLGIGVKTGFLDIWEPAVLAIKKDGYSIKCGGPSDDTSLRTMESFVSIPYGSTNEFSIIDYLGTERILRVDSSLTDISGLNSVLGILKMLPKKIQPKLLRCSKWRSNCISWELMDFSRDTIVLTFRLFILKAGEKKRKKRSLFFNK
ncbi:hypothetical protein STAS_14017 [Striga asiatica]|uniref:Uncharacterized protein n=1 Tax=Striga asiatica TaxID=4170 RepID=A0A5A7PXL7_STRAF|nr:hypothetical protein STAS_14017 [Striga asiatica]